MYSTKGVVYKLHAGWFINRTQGEFINWGLLLSLRVFSVEMLQREREQKVNIKFLAARQFISVSPAQAP